MTIYGPHCSHSDCSMLVCDHANDLASGIQYGCRKQASCPYCGPDSPNWGRLAAEWLTWCQQAYGTTNPDELAALNVPANVTETARLVALNTDPAT